MHTLNMTLLALATLAAAGYVHYTLASRNHRISQGRIARLILFVTGVGFGYVVVNHYAKIEGLTSLLVFLSGFGVVHVPAAFILFLKHKRAQGAPVQVSP